MTEPNPFNLFAEASKHVNRPSRSKEKVSNNLPPAATKDKLEEGDIEQMLNKMKDMHDEITKKLADTCDRFGMSETDISHFLSNSNNFRTEEWKHTQKQRQELLAKIWETLGKGEELRVAQEELEKKDKNRKGKTLGSRRHWISMH